MPPKKGKKEQGPKKDSKKNAADKTFGLKNKNKSAKVQRFVKEVESTALSTAAAKKELAMQKRRAEEKKAAELAKAEARALFGQIEQRVPFGVDPKSVLCINFRDGRCLKGAKCKFSHDMNVNKKATKKDLYTDDRAKKEADTMDTWDEEKLRSVINSKHGNPITTTDKICKYFIEAVENSKYGWFWTCPNGGSECKYRHSLPEGFVLKTKEQKRLEKLALDQQPKITLEEFIETERHKLPKANLTPITIETFRKWKENNIIRKLNAEKKDPKERRLTGREIIQKKFSDKRFQEDDEEGAQYFDFSSFKKELDPEDTNIKDYGDGKNATFEMPKEDTESEHSKSSSENSTAPSSNGDDAESASEKTLDAAAAEPTTV